MSEMRNLREALKTREALAPDPDAVLAGAHGRIRRRRAQRRIAGAAAAVAVVIAGAGAGMTVLRPSNEPESIEAAAGATDLPVPAPALPFTVGELPSGFELSSWTVSGSAASGRYNGYYGNYLEISVGDFPDADVGESGIVTDLAGGGTQAKVRIAPDRVVSVLTKTWQIPDINMLQIARSVRLVPTPVHSMLRSLRAPAGLTVRQWSGDARYEYLTLCPHEVPAQSPARSDGRCYNVSVNGPVPPTTTRATTTTDVPAPMVGVKTVRRILDGGKVLMVDTEQGQQAVVEAIAASAVAG